eukprot:gi/632965033/ref/XP_007898690.1/ PREDICTED: src kinase-associated phosphoprotein 2 isoform X2 [Callorhinchus milii]
MESLPGDVRSLITDLETFALEVLKGENLSKKAKEKKDALLKKLKDVKASYPQEFQEKEASDDSDNYEEPLADTISMTSERFDNQDEASPDVQRAPPIPAQELPQVLKTGYLEKRRKDHSFFGSEWQKRWCALSNNVFYYYGTEKDKQQKGEFAIDGYIVQLINSLRKDGKKDCCFELCAPEKRLYQFAAATPQEAEEWVEQLQFVLKDRESGMIPVDDDDEETYDDVDTSVDTNVKTFQTNQEPIDDDIYEELPEEEENSSVPIASSSIEVEKMSQHNSGSLMGEKATDHANYYQGLWDCSGDQADELSFKRGDAIYVVSKQSNDSEQEVNLYFIRIVKTGMEKSSA